MSTSRLPLEDTFGDILCNAMRGVGVGTQQVAQAT